MKFISLFTVAGTIYLGSVSALYAHMDDNHKKHEQFIQLSEVVPDAERKQAQKDKIPGPKKTVGIENVRVMGKVGLAGQFENLDKRILRAREIDIAPGGKVAVHEHNGRPGVAYIVHGQLTEHRLGTPGPVVKKAGDTAFEKTGVTHWWINEGKTTARIIVVDIIAE